MRNDISSSELLAAMLPSRSPAMFQGFEESVVAASKRQLYSIFENSEELITADDDDDASEFSHHVEKKRRLTADQLKSLERNFEAENKLEPERKLRLARDLGLQPRQVAVWFQNRRARWKTKQLEKDFDNLKADYEALKGEYEAAIQEKEKLQAQVICLNEKLRTSDSNQKPHPEISTLEQGENTLMESALHMQNQMSNESAQSSLDSQMSPLLLPVRKRRSSSSNSDESEVLDVESPQLEHPTCSELANLGCADPPSLIGIGEDYDEKVFPQIQTPRSVVKLEDESYPEESSNFPFSLEDPISGFSWWDWP